MTWVIPVAKDVLIEQRFEVHGWRSLVDHEVAMMVLRNCLEVGLVCAHDRQMNGEMEGSVSRQLLRAW
jgi:hypothetical protein